MSDDEAGATYTVTLKFGQGFNDPWVVIRGADEGELMQRLKAFSDRGLSAVVSSVARECHAVYTGSARFDMQPVQEGSAQPARQAQPAQQRPAQSGDWPPGMEPKYCKHGQMVYREGTKQNGDPWAGAFCPRPKNDPDQCKVQWLKAQRR